MKWPGDSRAIMVTQCPWLILRRQNGQGAERGRQVRHHHSLPSSGEGAIRLVDSIKGRRSPAIPTILVCLYLPLIVLEPACGSNQSRIGGRHSCLEECVGNQARRIAIRLFEQRQIKLLRGPKRRIDLGPSPRSQSVERPTSIRILFLLQLSDQLFALGLSQQARPVWCEANS